MVALAEVVLSNCGDVPSVEPGSVLLGTQKSLCALLRPFSEDAVSVLPVDDATAELW